MSEPADAGATRAEAPPLPTETIASVQRDISTVKDGVSR
jgi:hypothetical protein